ncbi:unnamed protein product, partial [Staurois parvus]
AAGWRKYLLALDQAKAFDRVNHEYLWLLLGRYGLKGRFIDWHKTLYRGAESFPLVNGWVGSFEVGSGVRQGCPLSPLLYAFTNRPLCKKARGCIIVRGASEHCWCAAFEGHGLC